MGVETSIVISDLKDALEEYGISNKMLAVDNKLSIRLKNGNLCTITLYNRGENSAYYEPQYFIYKIQVEQTGNILEENRIRIPEFIVKSERCDSPIQFNEVNDQNSGVFGYKQCYIYRKGTSNWAFVYESQNLLDVIPTTIEEIADVIDFYNG